jgi:hypothetical protein
MPYSYSEDFERLADALGFAKDPINPLVHLRSPASLSNWTLPVVEGLMISGAGLAFIRALERWREEQDPTQLAVLLSSVAYLFVTESPLYFPDKFRLPESVKDIFAHNVFSVQFLFEHLPLYIVALYPAMAGLAYDVVQSLGGMERNPLLGAVSVGFIHHLFYEIFDQIGPQLKWWIWNGEKDTNNPMIASVPMTSAFMFATVGPAAMAALSWLFVGRKASSGDAIGGWSLLGRSTAIGTLIPASLALGGLPAGLVGADRKGVQRLVYSGLIALTGAVAGPYLTGSWRLSRSAELPKIADRPWFSVGYGGLYLASFAALWAKKGLPDYLAAKERITADGTPVGSVLYSLGCAALAAVAVVGAATARSSRGRRFGAAKLLRRR